MPPLISLRPNNARGPTYTERARAQLAPEDATDSHPMQLLLQRERVNPSFFCLSDYNLEWTLFLECSRNISGGEFH
ncbi:hypothetical protein CEXT_624491 [Caerostris extrusa]|uniref:Uncharacterized protein n=1 Tax=Caerostris extrusa TaxID=172846 RepID=A0AAV4U4W9_CAEEX|nr:hypothetical protein CEXT_624491 [Caerostris extrusa]